MKKKKGPIKKKAIKKKNEDYLERKVRPVELLTGLRCNEGHLCSDKLMHARYNVMYSVLLGGFSINVGIDHLPPNFGMLVDLATKSA